MKSYIYLAVTVFSISASAALVSFSSAQLLTFALKTREAHFGFDSFEKRAQELLETSLYWKSTLTPKEKVLARMHLGESYMITGKYHAALGELQTALNSQCLMQDQRSLINNCRMNVITLITRNMERTADDNEVYESTLIIRNLLADIGGDYLEDTSYCSPDTLEDARDFFKKNQALLRS